MHLSTKIKTSLRRTLTDCLKTVAGIGFVLLCLSVYALVVGLGLMLLWLVAVLLWAVCRQFPFMSCASVCISFVLWRCLVHWKHFNQTHP